MSMFYSNTKSGKHVIKSWCKDLLKHKRISQIWSLDDKGIVCGGNMYLNDMDLTEIPYKIYIIRGHFDISNNELDNLNNFPNFIEGDLVIDKNVDISNINNICDIRGKIKIK